jgi:hypothetical protein
VFTITIRFDTVIMPHHDCSPLKSPSVFVIRFPGPQFFSLATGSFCRFYRLVNRQDSNDALWQVRILERAEVKLDD